MNDIPVKKKGCGCVGKGCIVLIIILGLLIGLGVWGYKKLIAKARTYSSSEPVQVAADNGTQDEYDALVKKLDAFKDASPGSGQTLELTADDLNVLLAFSPEWIAARGKIHAAIDKDVIGLTGSVPLSSIPGLNGQYLNGGIYFTPSMSDKVLNVSMQSIDFKGGKVSDDDLKTFGTYWTAYLKSSRFPLLGPVLAKAKTLKVEDGAILLTSE